MSQRVAIEAIIVSPSPRPGLSGCGVIPRPSSSTRTSTQPSPASAVSATRPRSRPTNAWMIALVTASETASVMLLIASSDGAVGARELRDAAAQLRHHGGLRVHLAMPAWRRRGDHRVRAPGRVARR